CFNPSFIFRLNLFPFFQVYIASLQLKCLTSLLLPCDKWTVSLRPYSVTSRIGSTVAQYSLIAFVFLPSLLYICILSLAL
ncbi:unnamed protein product, partial [Prunus brigantina]